MSTYDPRLLIRVLSDLEEKLQRFTLDSSDTLKEAEYIQRCAEERTNQAIRCSAIAKSQVEYNLEDVQEIEVEVSRIVSQCSTAIETSHQTLAIVNQAQQKADSTLNHWQNELQIALAWQARAEVRLDQAIQIYQQAERNVESARNALSRSEARLRRCINDQDRKNCNSEERAYNNAKAAVLVALEELQEAEIEVLAAQEELERAKARVGCCQKAVNYAEQAVHHAKLAVEQAEQALSDAERSSESAESANRAASNAQAKSTEADEQVEQLLIRVHQSESFTNEAQVYNQTSRLRADSAHRLSKLGTLELKDRIRHLISLNQASLEEKQRYGVDSLQKSVGSPDIAGNVPSKPFKYREDYNYLDEFGSIRIVAETDQGTDIGFIIAAKEKESDSSEQVRVRIKDTEVAKKYRRKGIASSLLQNLEERLPIGTELYFQENQEPDYWKDQGFQERTLLDGSREYFKKIQKLI
ncbi:MAG: hypothetical protein HLUCCO16_20180 [Phormidium sp. OSCR]|nr:MAG: hypothetical protein HLUCCO16_20180 [Phormidium sp. OSCR]